MDPATFLTRILDPAALAFTAATGIAQTPEARVLLLAIAQQESGCTSRMQFGGPARGFWQFEVNGTKAMTANAACQPHLLALGAYLSLPEPVLNGAALYEAVAWSDVIAYACARLLLWSDAAPLPAIGDAAGGWGYYQRNWRPGAPRPADWTLVSYPAALAAVTANPLP